jgi:omega-6 fatty acid desaturase (delta-12 desaturase)
MIATTIASRLPESRIAMSDLASTLPSRRDLVRELSVYATPQTARGLWLFATDIALYALAVAGVLFLRPLWAKISCAVFAGMALARMFSLAHNAAHENIVRNPRLNRVLAVVLFTPFFYNYVLWMYEHHTLHHPYPNDTKPDAYKPFGKAEFDALPRWRQLLERFYRAPTIIGWGVYYLLQRHWSTKLAPPAYLPASLRRAAWWNAALLVAYGAVMLSLLAVAPLYAVNLTPIEALLIGFVLPLFVFEIHDGFALYVQHTDPRIAWFNGAVDRNAEGRAEILSVHLRVPRLMGWFYHDAFAHPVHHLHPKIPCYRVYQAQTKLDERLGPAAVVSAFNMAWFLDTTRRCKLYDWDKRQWLDFTGCPTAPAAIQPPITAHE